MAEPRFRRFSIAWVIVAIGLGLGGCGGGWEIEEGNDDDEPDTSIGDTVAITAAGRVISFDRSTPGTLRSERALSGLAAGEQVVGVDIRPADGKLYALSNQARLYTIEPSTGAASLKSTLVAANSDDSPFSALAGTSFGVDFNPVTDRLRVVGTAGQNLRIDVDSGVTITDTNLTGVGGAITAAAYTNAFVGTTTTRLHALDAATGLLHLQDPPDNGTLMAPLPLAVSATASNGFDIDPVTNIGYAALAADNATRLYTVSLSGGTATRVGTIGTGEALVGLALRPLRPAPSGIVLTSDSQLAGFALASPNALDTLVTITGLGGAEAVIGIDFRPANGKLYALTSLGRLLTVDPATGASTLASTLAADPADPTARYSGLPAGLYSVDFDAAADRLRVVSATGLNLRINVDTGATTSDAVINRNAPATIVGAAYTNSFAGASSTRLYDIDAAQDVLAEQTSPNNGTLVSVGALGTAIVVEPGPIDIAGGDNGLVLAALRSSGPGPYSLYNVSLTTGAATLARSSAALSQIGGANGPVIVDLAIRY